MDYQRTCSVSPEKSSKSGRAIRFIRRCNSNRLSATFGQFESVTIIALSRVDMVILSCGFGSARTRNTTISSNSFARIGSQALAF